MVTQKRQTPPNTNCAIHLWPTTSNTTSGGCSGSKASISSCGTKKPIQTMSPCHVSTMQSGTGPVSVIDNCATRTARAATRISSSAQAGMAAIDNTLAKVCTKVILIYQRYISRYRMKSCRYWPSCSAYAIEALALHGLGGMYYALARLLRCHPWCAGGIDFPPGHHHRREHRG